jgi:hypothetical protein
MGEKTADRWFHFGWDCRSLANFVEHCRYSAKAMAKVKQLCESLPRSALVFSIQPNLVGKFVQLPSEHKRSYPGRSGLTEDIDSLP